MFTGQITYDHLTLRYPPSVAQFLMEEIEKVQQTAAIANQDPVNENDPVGCNKAFLLQRSVKQ